MIFKFVCNYNLIQQGFISGKIYTLDMNTKVEYFGTTNQDLLKTIGRIVTK